MRNSLPCMSVEIIQISLGLQLVGILIENASQICLRFVKTATPKATPANPRTYTSSVLKCNCWYSNAIVGTILKKMRFARLRV